LKLKIIDTNLFIIITTHKMDPESESNIIIQLYDALIPPHPYGSPDPIKFRNLIELNPGINLNAIYKQSMMGSMNLLCQAVMCGQLDNVKLLVDKGAEMNQKTPVNPIQCDALYYAITQYKYPFTTNQSSRASIGKNSPWPERLDRYYDIIKYLLDHGAIVNCDSINPEVTPTATYGSYQADYQHRHMHWDNRCPGNTTALMTICGFHHDSYAQYHMHKLAQLLLDYGANRDLVNDDGETAAEIAHQYGNFELEGMIRDYQPVETKGCHMDDT